jgi:predicted nucleic-acid-binding Zn-ribbon protein
MPRPKTQVEVIEQFHSTHGDRYDYSQVVYSTSLKKVEVTCRKHGLFYISPGHHMNGVGCRKCYFEKQKTTKAEFVEKSKAHFGNRYDYSSFSELPEFGKKVRILCTAHDLEFLQEPRNHLNGHVGCPKCKSLKHALGDGQLNPSDDASQLLGKFVERAHAVHGKRYGYEEFVYNNASTKGRITCSMHGNFYQTPSNHLRGSLCPACARESLKEGTLKQKCEKLGIDYRRSLKRRQAGL